MSARPKPVRDFNPNSQAVGATAHMRDAGGSGKGTQAGGSAPTPQAAIMKRGPAGGKSTVPKSAQRIRG